jgi:hypothetical protein
MFRLYQHSFQKTTQTSAANLHSNGLFPQLLGYVKLLAVVLLLQQALVCDIHAQGVSENGFVVYTNAPSGTVPATQGDMFLPANGVYEDAQVAVSDPSAPIVPLPIADYTGNFGLDADNYKQVVLRWLEQNPASLTAESSLVQKLIALEYYDTLLKWQMQCGNINKTTSK